MIEFLKNNKLRNESMACCYCLAYVPCESLINLDRSSHDPRRANNVFSVQFAFQSFEICLTCARDSRPCSNSGVLLFLFPLPFDIVSMVTIGICTTNLG